jgi:D-alanine-D-alanine ligase
MIKVGIIYGGYSIESGYSIKAAEYLSKVLKEGCFELVMMPVNDCSEWLTNLELGHVDILISLLYGCPGQEGIVQGLAEIQGIPYLGSDLFSCCIIKDKYMAKTIAEKLGIFTPNYLQLTLKEYESKPNEVIDLVMDKIGFPCVIKPCRKGGLSLGITYCDKKENIAEGLMEAFQYDEVILVEEFVTGTELSTCIVEKDGVPMMPAAIEIVKDTYICDYKSKAEGKRRLNIPARISTEINELVEEVSKKLFTIFQMKDYGYFDLIVREGSVYFIEAGAMPGFTENSNLTLALDSCGMTLTQVLKELITRRVNVNENITYQFDLA